VRIAPLVCRALMVIWLLLAQQRATNPATRLEPAAEPIKTISRSSSAVVHIGKVALVKPDRGYEKRGREREQAAQV
jgi:hypothetical protein